MKPKRFTVITFLLIFSTHFVYAQDVMTLQNGDDIKAKVLEIGISEITYKKWENLEGPSYHINKTDVFRITYKNGTKEVISTGGGTAAPASNLHDGYTTPVVNSGGATLSSGLYNNPSYPFEQVYLLNKQNNQITFLEQNISSAKYIAGWGWAVPPFYQWQVQGYSSSVRANGQVSFIAKLAGTSASKIKLVRYTNIEKKDGSKLTLRRVTAVGSYWDGYTSTSVANFPFSSTPDFIIPVTVVPTNDGLYEVIPSRPLTRGEYGFAVGDYFYSFGID